MFLNNDEIRRKLDLCLRFLELNEWLVNAFILEFFTASYWSLLLPSWQEFLPKIEPGELSAWIRTGEQKKVWPLSLLVFRALVESASLDRKPVQDLTSLDEQLGSSVRDGYSHHSFQRPEDEMTSAAGQHKDLLHVFRRHVKPKKQHEIFRLAKLCSLCAKSTSCSNLVDVGSGVGHLARFLHYGHGLNVACLEAEDGYSNSAKKFDDDLVVSLKKNGEIAKTPPSHIVCRLLPETDIETFHKVTSDTIPGPFGIVGLHTCGDLGPSMLRYFVESTQIRYLVSVGCCYMKMDLNLDGVTADRKPLGYPLSKYVSSKNYNSLSYESREISCHALEMYLEKLNVDEVQKLKVHCYRAAVECILVAKDPALKRSGLRGVKNAHLLPFERYAQEAVKNSVVTLESSDLTTVETSERLDRWQDVYKFYTLRLLLAPVIETVILLDRLMYLREKGLSSTILPLFDPRLSARNLVILSVKK